MANVYASATEGGQGGDTQQSDANGAWGPGTIDCPDVGDRLTDVPDGAREQVDKELALLDQQVAEAYQRLQESAAADQQDSGSADDTIMKPLKEKRAETIERIAAAIDQAGERPEGLEDLAACTLRQQTQDQNQGQEQNQDQGQDQNQGQGQGENQGAGNGGQAGNGPVAADFVDIKSVQPNVQSPALQGDASRGTFATSCGVNAGGLFNSDNVIVAPGVSNGAHHFHDYVGNQSNNAFASDDDLANADTSCQDQGDKSTYYWPVLRLQNGTQEKDAGSPGGGTEGNAGEIVTPQQVTLTFVGSPRGPVAEMPRLLRIITGDAKAFVNGNTNANASWSCTGFEDRQLKDKYPLCPGGSDVVRTFKFQSCWDGRNIDSANHRTHVAFAAADGSCPGGFEAIPQLVQRIVYDVDAPSLQDGGKTTPLFAVDSFPEQLHKPVTDHGDFINVFDEDLMKEMVDCINGGRQCGVGAEPGNGGGNGGNDNGGNGNGGGDNGGANGGGNGGNDNGGGGNGGNDNGGGGNGGNDNGGNGGGNGGGEQPGDDGGDEPTAPPATAPGDDDATATPAPQNTEPRVYSSPKATTRPNEATARPESDDKGGGLVTTAPDASQTAAPGQAQDAGDDGQNVSDAQTAPQTEPQTEPQAVQGGLAETGAQLWPAALGAVLAIAGIVLLTRTRRRTM